MITVETENAIYSDIVGAVLQPEWDIVLVRDSLKIEDSPKIHFKEKEAADSVFKRLRQQLLREKKEENDLRQKGAKNSIPCRFTLTGELSAEEIQKQEEPNYPEIPDSSNSQPRLPKDKIVRQQMNISSNEKDASFPAAIPASVPAEEKS